MPKPKREALPFFGVDAAVAQHVRVNHPAAAELQPRTVGAGDVELGRRLGEREVRRTEAGLDLTTEEGTHELVHRAGEIAQRDASIDDETFDLVEGRKMGGVGGVGTEGPARATM